jgi:hypothetical protein
LKKNVLGLTLLTIMLAMPMMISSVGATEWVEVTRFSGSETEQHITDYFTCDHVDWRIRWEYMPEDASFIVYTYQQKRIVDSITEGAKVEATLSWHPIIESFESAPEDFYLRISVDGDISNLAEFQVNNVTLNLMFEVRYPISSTSGLLAAIGSFNRNETVNIGTLAANETKQINEKFIYEVDFRSIWSDSVFSYDIEWDKSDGASGVSYIQDQEGTFYMEIITNAENYTIIIEQDTDSIPEFTSFALIVALITVSVLAVALSKKVEKWR